VPEQSSNIRSDMRSRKGLLLAFLLCAACNPVRGCPESNFRLMPESRLPRWFVLPVGYARDDVTVKLTYYAPPVPVDDVVMELVDQRNNHTLSRITGKACWHSQIDGSPG